MAKFFVMNYFKLIHHNRKNESRAPESADRVARDSIFRLSNNCEVKIIQNIYQHLTEKLIILNTQKQLKLFIGIFKTENFFHSISCS